MSELVRKKTDCPYCGAKESMEVAGFNNNELVVTIQLAIPNNEATQNNITPKAKFGFYAKKCSKCGLVLYFDKGTVDNNGEI